MDDDAVSVRIRSIIADTFRIPVEAVTRTTTSEDIDGWDSLGHSVLITRLSRKLCIDIDDWSASERRSVGHLIDILVPMCGKPS